MCWNLRATVRDPASLWTVRKRPKLLVMQLPLLLTQFLRMLKMKLLLPEPSTSGRDDNILATIKAYMKAKKPNQHGKDPETVELDQGGRWPYNPPGGGGLTIRPSKSPVPCYPSKIASEPYAVEPRNTAVVRFV